MMKTCSTCGTTYPLDAFSTHPTCKNGRRGTCRSCASSLSKEHIRKRRTTFIGRMALLINGCRARLSHRGLPCDITPEFLSSLYVEQKGLCAISGIPLDLDDAKSPRYISIDRKDSKEGYTTSNVQFVLLAVNLGKGRWHIDEVRPIWEAASGRKEVAE